MFTLKHASIAGSLQVLEFFLLEMRDKLHRARLALDVDLELNLEGEIGGDPFPFPDPNILLDYSFRAVEIQVGRLLHVVNREGRRDANPFPDLSGRLLLFLFYLRRGGEVGGEGDPARESPRSPSVEDGHGAGAGRKRCDGGVGGRKAEDEAGREGSRRRHCLLGLRSRVLGFAFFVGLFVEQAARS